MDCRSSEWQAALVAIFADAVLHDVARKRRVFPADASAFPLFPGSFFFSGLHLSEDSKEFDVC